MYILRKIKFDFSNLKLYFYEKLLETWSRVKVFQTFDQAGGHKQLKL